MRDKNMWGMLVVLCFGLLMWSCQQHAEAHHTDHPADVEHIEGSELSRVTLSEKAVERLDVKTTQVSSQKGKITVPYASIIYDPHGQTWVYTSPQARTFVRAKVTVDRIEGDWAHLSDGPAVGTTIATVGVAEIYGTEFEVGH